MARDQAGVTQSVLAQGSDCDLRESSFLDPLLDHLARASVMLALETELKAFVRARNSDSGVGTGKPVAAGRSATAWSKKCLGSLKLALRQYSERRDCSGAKASRQRMTISRSTRLSRTRQRG